MSAGSGEMQAAEDGSSLWATYRPMLRGRGRKLTAMGATSFGAGVAEALMLVLIATIALTVGSSDDSSNIPEASLGPLASLDLTVRTMFVVALGLGFLRAVLQLLSARVAAGITAELTAEIRAATFADFASASWAEQSQRKETDIQDLLLRHVGRITAAVGLMAQGITTFCAVIALLASAIIVDPLSAALLFVSGGTLFLLIRPLTGVAKRISNAQLLAGRAYAAHSLKAIETSLEIRSFGVTGAVTERLRQATADEVRPTYRALVLRQLVTSLYQLATILLLLSGMFAVYTVVDRPLASLGAIVVILVRALNQTGGLQNIYHSLMEAVPFVHRMDRERAQLRSSAPKSGARAIDVPKSLRFEEVSYSYRPGSFALTDVSFEVARGEAIGIIGPSGSGKSTLIQLILRLREPSTGRYFLDGTDAADVDDTSWFRQIAFVPQESRLLDDTIAANIAFYRGDARQNEIVAAAQRAHIHEEIMAMPSGYDTIVGARGGALSGGQRQRISIARALLRDPSILVLDEPTSALDMRSESLVHETFTQLKGRITVFAIAHRLSTLNTCDRIMVMEEGRLQAFGTREELQRRSIFYKDAVELSKIRS